MQPDLVALVIELQAQMPTYISNHMGRAVQAIALGLIAENNPLLAQHIHDDNQPKPFTVSGLMQDDALLYGHVQTGDQAWIRITGLSAEIAQVLLMIYHQPPETISISQQAWRITHVHISDHRYAGNTSYQTLIQRHTTERPNRQINMRFITPTTFKIQDVTVPLPLPFQTFDSLLSRWITFTAHRLHDLHDDQLNAYIARHIVISQHRIQTALIRGKNGGKEISFLGDVTYELLPKSEYLAKHDPALENLLQAERVWFARTMSLLAEFAFYSGVGRKTTIGMGLVIEK
jgi:CRISPR-associated endoribonuclease Cas6